MPFALHTEGFRDNPDRLAFLHGPLVLAAEIDPGRPTPVIVAASRPLVEALVPVAGRGSTFRVDGLFRRPGESGPVTMTFEPFFRVHGARHYGVYWDVYSPDAWRTREAEHEAEQARARELDSRTVDVVVPGGKQSERDHAFVGDRTEAGLFLGRTWRHAGRGWFGYSLKVEPGKPQQLLVTYWGGDGGNRTFDVEVDGKVIATETLRADRPGRFFDQAYDLPEELSRDRDRILVRFRAGPGQTAGGVFGIRVVRSRSRRTGAGDPRPAGGLGAGPDGAVAAQSPATGITPLDLGRHEGNLARVEPDSEPGGAIRAAFQPAPWPNVRFPAPDGRPWDWSSQDVLLMELRNPERHAIEFGIRIDDDPSADGKVHCRTAQGRLQPGESATFSVALDKVNPMAHGMRGLPVHAGTRSLAASGQGPFNLAHIVAFQIYLHQPGEPRTLEIRSARLAAAISLAGIVDPFGQYAKADWPGKVRSESDLIHRHELEAADLRAHPAPPDRDRFGGWGDGPKQAATGFFRTAQVDGRWWLVDPDGALFISLGIDVVTPNEATIITGRESMFTALPEPGDPLARHFGTIHQVHSGPVRSGRTFNFYAANLARTYGPDFIKPWGETTLNRLRSWGLNTIGNWSDHRLYRNGRIPYVATVTIHGDHARVGSGSDYWGRMHDPFDPEFAASAENSLRDVAALVKGDPWCLGYFVDNELSWGGFGDENGRYGLALGALSLSAASSPAKRALLDRLKQQHADISKLNAAWGTALTGWPASRPRGSPPPVHRSGPPGSRRTWPRS